MELNKMTNAELVARIEDYIQDLNQLMLKIDKYRDGDNDVQYPEIRDEYTRLKREMKADAAFVRLQANKNSQAEIYQLFSDAITEAAIKGFSVRTTAAVDQRLYGSVYDAENYLQYYMQTYINAKIKELQSNEK